MARSHTSRPPVIGEDRLLGAHPCLVNRIEVRDNSIARLLVISERESNEQRNGLIAERRAAVEPLRSVAAAGRVDEPAVETTRAKRLADNLRSKPRYRSTLAGPVFAE